MSDVGAKSHRKADLLVIVGLLALALVLYLALNLGREAGGVAVVRVDGQEVECHSLAVDGTFVLNGGSNTLVIEKGEAYMKDADCPDQICVKHGRVHYTHQVITCLPNRLTVTIEGGESNGVDFTVGGVG